MGWNTLWLCSLPRSVWFGRDITNELSCFWIQSSCYIICRCESFLIVVLNPFVIAHGIKCHTFRIVVTLMFTSNADHLLLLSVWVATWYIVSSGQNFSWHRMDGSNWISDIVWWMSTYDIGMSATHTRYQGDQLTICFLFHCKLFGKLYWLLLLGIE